MQGVARFSFARNRFFMRGTDISLTLLQVGTRFGDNLLGTAIGGVLGF